MGRLIFTLLWLGSPVVSAQEVDVEQAKQLYSNGKMLFDEGRYAEALLAWQIAYEQSEQPLLLFNMALAQEELGQIQAAIDTLYRYRIFAPKDEQASLVNKIADLTTKLEASMSVEEPVSEPESESVEEPAPETTANPQLLPDTAAPAVATQATKVPGLKPSTAWSVSGVAGVSGLTFGLLSLVKGNAAWNYCESTDNDRTLCTAQGETQTWRQGQFALAADISWGVSTLSAATAIWAMRNQNKGDTSSQTLSLWMGPAQVGLGGQF
jgi:tetratricopeptide (TPR) repeat protein